MLLFNRLERTRGKSVLRFRGKLFLLASEMLLFVLSSLNPMFKLKYAFEWLWDFNNLVTTVRHTSNSVTPSFK